MIILGQCNGNEALDRDRLSPFRRALVLLWAWLLPLTCGAFDVRWTALALGLRGLSVVAAFGRRQLARWAGNVLDRAWQGACFAAAMHDADSMVAAGGR